jgi:hypothetical protein
LQPQLPALVLVTKDGKTLVGLRLAEGGDDGTEEYDPPASVSS